jgi:protoporphyrinogen oxidase
MKKKCIIIGAGPAGLTAALELLRRSNEFEVTVLEASGEIGGISKTVNYKGNRMDIGGHRFFSKSDRVMNWWLDIMPLENNEETDLVIKYHGQERHLNYRFTSEGENQSLKFIIRDRLSRIYFLRKFFDYPIKLSFKTMWNLGVVRMISILFTYTMVKIRPISPETTLEDFFINRFGKELYLTFFKDYTEKVWGFKCNEISKDWGAQRVKGLSISTAIKHWFYSSFKNKNNDISQKQTETSLIERFIYPKYGPGQLWEEVAKQVELLGGRVILNQIVTGISSVSQNAISSVTTINDLNETTKYDSDIVFSTMAIKDLVNAFDFKVPTEIRHITDNLPYRDFITVGVLLDKMLVKDPKSKNMLIKDNWIYVQESDVKVGRLQIFNNWSPYLVSDPSKIWLGMEYFCSEGDDLWQLNDDEMSKFAMQELNQLQIAKLEDMIDTKVVRMKKTYPAYTGSYNRMPEFIDYINKFSNLFLIGRNGMHRYNNSDHSMLTAMIAVDNILSNITDKQNIWSVNTEDDYHETSK